MTISHILEVSSFSSPTNSKTQEVFGLQEKLKVLLSHDLSNGMDNIDLSDDFTCTVDEGFWFPLRSCQITWRLKFLTYLLLSILLTIVKSIITFLALV